MRFYKIGLGIFVCLLVVVSTSSVPNLPIATASRVLAQTTDARKAEADQLLEQGFQQYQTSQFTAALQSWQQALSIYREIQDRQGEGNALGNLGAAYISLGEYPKAVKYQQQRLAIAREIQDRQGEGAALGNLGIAYDSLGDYKKAIEYQQQFLRIAREMQNHQGEGKALLNLGNSYFSLGDYKKAIEYGQESLAIAREIQDRQSEGQSLGNLGLAYRSLGDYKKAIDYGQQSLAIALEIQDRQSAGTALGNLGLAYLDLGDNKKAIEYLQKILAIAREIQNRQSEGTALGNLGVAYLDLGDNKKAIDYGQKFLAIAREIKDRQGEGAALGNLGNAYYSLGDYKKAIEYQQQILAIAREIQDRKGEGTALSNLGVAFYKQGNLSLAESTLIESIKVKESLRGRELKDSEKVSIFETQRNTYNTLQEVLIAQNKIDAALEIAERGRGRAFVELLASRLSTNPKEQSPAPPNIAEIKQIAKSQNATLVQYSIIYDYFKIAGKSEPKESELYIWVIKPTGEVLFHSSDLKSLSQNSNTNLFQLVENVRASIGVVDVSSRAGGIVAVGNGVDKTNQNKRLKQLHEVLIKPIAEILPKNPNDRVIFIPQGSLFLVPFPALQDADNKYLIEKHTILTAPSIQVLSLTRQQKLKNGAAKIGKSEALVVGNPTMPSVAFKLGEKPQQLPSLLGAEREAMAIAPLLKTKAITGSQATETAIAQKMPQARFIHLATHGLLDDNRGLGSALAEGFGGAIALAPSGKDDGLLTAEEILNLKLNADLVVLSACDTGRGRITGDGVIGLSRSLISAGVSSVLVSLWSVDDDSTAFLMTEFYQNLQQGIDKATALRKAMLTTRNKYTNPLQWSAFTLIGEAE